jgi:opacity protein-like surface antigen
MIVFSIFPAIAQTSDSLVSVPRSHRITARLDLNYVPVSSTKFNNRDETYDIYDNLFYRVAIDYAIGDFLTIGPSFEYLNRHIEPTILDKRKISVYGYFLECRFNYNFTDSSSSFFVLGMGTGIAYLKEAIGNSNTGVAWYGVVGLDLAVSGPVGCDLLYRYQLTRVKVEDRDYRFDGSAIQAGLNYRFTF